MRRWLGRLPKPIAIFAAYDRRGQQIIRCCRAENIQVPEQVAVLGMDNDREQCESIYPHLSSIRQNVEKAGYSAALALDKYMRGNRGEIDKTRLLPPRVITTGPECVVTRHSTDISLIPGNKVVARAMSFINNERSPVHSVGELAQKLHVTERTLLRYFQTTLGCSVYDVIAKARLTTAKHLLRHSELTLQQVAKACGFADTSHLSRVFKRATETSPGAWRRQQAQTFEEKK